MTVIETKTIQYQSQKVKKKKKTHEISRTTNPKPFNKPAKWTTTTFVFEVVFVVVI
jgi:hypothetical protein